MKICSAYPPQIPKKKNNTQKMAITNSDKIGKTKMEIEI